MPSVEQPQPVARNRVFSRAKPARNGSSKKVSSHVNQHSDYRSCSDADRCPAALAPQRKLGLPAQRRPWHCCRDLVDFAVDRTALNWAVSNNMWLAFDRELPKGQHTTTTNKRGLWLGMPSQRPRSSGTADRVSAADDFVDKQRYGLVHFLVAITRWGVVVT